MVRGCGCASNCWQLFDREHYSLVRDEASGLSREMLDMLVIGQIRAFTETGDVVGPSHKHSAHQRQRTKTQAFTFTGKRVCRETFMALHGIGTHYTFVL